MGNGVELTTKHLQPAITAKCPIVSPEYESWMDESGQTSEQLCMCVRVRERKGENCVYDNESLLYAIFNTVNMADDRYV